MAKRNHKVDVFAIRSISPIDYSVRAKCRDIVLYNESYLFICRKDNIGSFSGYVRRKLQENPNTQVLELPNEFKLDLLKSLLVYNKFTCLDLQAEVIIKILDFLEIKHETVYHDDLKSRDDVALNRAEELWRML